MKTIKRVLGLLVAVTLCILGLASCGGSSSTIQTNNVSITYKEETIKGDLFVQTHGTKEHGYEYEVRDSYTYFLLSDDGNCYIVRSSKGQVSGCSKYGDYKIYDDVIWIGEKAYLLKTDYIVSPQSLVALYKRVGGILA